MIHGDVTSEFMRVAMASKARVWKKEQAQKIADAERAAEKVEKAIETSTTLGVRVVLLEALVAHQKTLIQAIKG